MDVSGNLWIFPNVVNPLVVYDVERRIAMGKCRGNALHLELIWVQNSTLHS